MRLLLLSWEYPPVVYGGLARHVHALSTSLARLGHDVVVLTQHGDPPPPAGANEVHEGVRDGVQEGAHDEAVEEVRDGVRLLRVRDAPPRLPGEDFLAWTMGLNHTLTRTALRVLGDWRPDVIHAHDWLVAHTAATLHAAWGAPVVATVHATEAGRWHGWLPEPRNRAIHTVEWWLTWIARRVIVCSRAMRTELATLFDVPPDKTEVVRNGIEATAWSPRTDSQFVAGERWRDGGPLLVFSGRLEYEKGVQTVLSAMRTVRRRHPGARLVIAGRGRHEQDLRAQARALRLGRAVRFAGWLDDDELRERVGSADLALVPSTYEPFGLVALEAAAAGTPVMVAATGGLVEVIEHDRTGWVVAPGDARAWAEAIDHLLGDPDLRGRLAKQARVAVEREHRWDDVARQTVGVYERAQSRRVPHPRPSFVVADGNQLR